MTEIWRIVFTRHIIKLKLIVNVNVSKMAFAQKKTSKTESIGRHVYGNSRRHSQLLRGYFSDLHHTHIKDLDFIAVLRPRLRKGCRSQNQYINDKHLLIQKALSE